MRGGLNLVSPQTVIPPGQAIAAINYVPDAGGYTRFGGYERFDGRDRPSDSDDPSTVAARRAAIGVVPGTGAVRGVAIYGGAVLAFRDNADGNARMHKNSAAGWVEQTFGNLLYFVSGTVEFDEGDTLVGGTSAATATIERVVQQGGAWDGSAYGFLVLSDIVGTFQAETITGGAGTGSATAQTGNLQGLTIPGGGHYDFQVHNFYGQAFSSRLYFANGVGNAHEWDGAVLAPIRTGTARGTATDPSFILDRNGDFILDRNGDNVIARYEFDRPAFITEYKQHLVVAFETGTLLNSSIGDPLEWITTTGAGEIANGHAINGIISSATALVVFSRDKISYMTGSDSSDFDVKLISDSSGAHKYSAQMLDQPVYLDDGGIRKLSATEAFGDWVMGTLSRLVEPLVRAKREAGTLVSASLRVKSRDQYWLFFDDATGLVMYVGGKDPEILPFKLPATVFCACAGEVTEGEGERVFVGAEDGYVYEMNRGWSFDGATINAYLRLPFNTKGSPLYNKQFHSLALDVVSEDDISLGIVYDIDYGTGILSDQSNVDVAAGMPYITSDLYTEITWTSPVQGKLKADTPGLGLNMAATIIYSDDDKEPHTIAAGHVIYSMRGLQR